MLTLLRSSKPMAHELMFGAFLVLTWLRLVAVQGLFGADSLVYLGVLTAGIAVAWNERRQRSRGSWRLHMAYFILAMNGLFTHMRTAIPAFAPTKRDDWLMAADNTLFGNNLSLVLESASTPWLTELMSFFYMLFMPYLFVSLGRQFFKERRQSQAFFAGLFSLYGLGFIGYTLVPALGPYLAMADSFQAPLKGYWLRDLLTEIYPLGTNYSDVFPSLHVAVSAFILFFDRKHARRRYRLYLVPVIGLWISTLYLRYHYAVDVLAGLLLAAGALWIARRTYQQQSI